MATFADARQPMGNYLYDSVQLKTETSSYGLDEMLDSATADLDLFNGQVNAYDLQDSGSSGDDHAQHPTEAEPERGFKRQERSAPADDALPGVEKKKPGRKPITDEPTTKRKAQNRAAQRAFRERKENHVKQLEDRVAELEQTAQSQQQENLFLKQQLERFRQSSAPHSRSFSPEQKFEPVGDRPFTFSLPPSVSPEQSSLSASASFAGTHRRTSQTSPAASSNDCPGLSPGSSSTNTSPQSNPEQDFFNPAALPYFGMRDPILLAQEASTASSSSLDTRSLPTNQTSLSPAMMAAAAASNTPFGQLTAGQGDSLSEPLLFTAGSQGDFFIPAFNPASPKPAFGNTPLDYRSNEDGLDTLDLFDDQLLFGGNTPQDFGSSGEKLFVDTRAATRMPPGPEQSVLACPEAWLKIVSHPKFESFDLDELCADMRKKAVCTAGSAAAATDATQASPLDRAAQAGRQEQARQAKMAMLDMAIESHASRH